MLLLNLELFGGRGGGSGGYVKASADGALQRVKPRIMEGIYRETGGPFGTGYYKEEILEAKTDGKGNLTFNYATPTKREKLAKTNRTQYLTYEVAHGAVDGRTFGIDWSKVQSINGQTYNLRAEAKENGLKWDSKNKRWARS